MSEFGDGLFDVFDDSDLGKKAKKRKKVEEDAAESASKAQKISEPVVLQEEEETEDLIKEIDEEPFEQVAEEAPARQKPRVVTLETIEACTHEVALPAEHSGDYVAPVKEGQADSKPAKEYPFVLDPFQKEALKCLEARESVLVSAHTSAGKTVVAEYAIAMSLRDKQRVIYTTPIKALSNQKYRDLNEEFGDVGLMTGDVTLNPGASCLVMTTEILRSMLYRGSEVMREVGWVVFDECHYMRDKERGVVWEETIILLPDNVYYVFLSATIPNARQFASWICYLHKQPVHVVYTDYRPVPLQHYVYPAGADGLYLIVDENGDFKEDNFQKSMSLLKDGDGRRKGTKGPSNCFKVVKMIMERNLQPVIVFSFSKRDCEAYALQMSKLDFNSDEEKSLVEEVFSNAIDALSDEDKHLPQVEHVLPLLKRGIGIHHGGLLPILKEVIEILFGEGLIKALFATETFSLGLNMPARTVVFSNPRKFDGKEFRWVTGGEYIQMSGRAGRRGIDEKGIVMLMVDEKMDPPVGKALLKGHSDPLNSAFYLNYNMVLNLLRVEEINPEYMLEKSFYQWQHEMAIPGMEEKMNSLQSAKYSVEIPEEKQAMVYYKFRQQLEKLAVDLHSYIVKPKHLLPFLQPGRLVSVKDGNDDYGWGSVVNFQKKAVKGEGSRYIVDVLLHCVSQNIPVFGKIPKPAEEKDESEMQVVPVSIALVESISSVRIYLPKDLKLKKNRLIVLKMIQEVKRRYKDKLPYLDPVEDMNITDEGFKRTVKKIESLEQRLFSHPLHSDPEMESIYRLCQKKEELASQVKATKSEIKKAKTVLLLDQLKCRKRVLRRLGYASASDVVELKGRVACEMTSSDCLLLTEMIFNGTFNDLTVEQTSALLSCFVFEEKSESATKLSEDLAGPLRVLQETARRIARIAAECKMEIDEEQYVQSFRTGLMDVVYTWAKGSTFSQLCKMTEVFEGSIIRTLRRLEELLREMCQAAKVIGNTELENKFSQGITKIKRDIVFAASLYL